MGVHPASTPTAQPAASAPTYPAIWNLFANELLNVRNLARQCSAQNLASVVGDQHDVFDADADILLRYVNARLDGDHGSRLEWSRRIAGIVNVQPDVVP